MISMRKILNIVVAALCCTTLFADEYAQALPGKFTINPQGDQVRFSPSMLTGNENYIAFSSIREQFVDVFDTDYYFAWGTGTNPRITNVVSTFVDWGSQPIINAAEDQPDQWRTMSADEWQYLLSIREHAEYLCGLAKISDKENTKVYRGLMLFPDDAFAYADGEELKFSDGIKFMPYVMTNEFSYTDCSEYTYEQWKQIEKEAGAVFSQAAYWCAGNKAGGTGWPDDEAQEKMDISYWTSTPLSYDQAKAMIITIKGPKVNEVLLDVPRNFQLPVRLVQDVAVVNTTTLSDAITAANDYYNEIKDIEGAETIAATLLFYIEKAQAVFNNPDASQEAVNAAADSLNAAVEQAKYDMGNLSGIEDVMYRDSSKQQKVLIDGHLYIILNGKFYNATGAEMK